MWKNFLKHFNFFSYDILNLLFTSVLFILVILFYTHLPFAKYLLITYILLLCLILFCSLFHKHSLIHYFYPVILIFFIFQSLGYLNPYLHKHFNDAFLYHLDIILFGQCPFDYLERFKKPWLTEILQLGYISYYFMPIILISILFKKHDKKLSSIIFTILLGFYLSYIGYLIFPAEGPRGLGINQQSIYGGTWLAIKLFKILNFLEKNRLDAFPSGHTEISIICAYFAFYSGKKLGFFFSLFTILLIFSTVYCRYHYVVDVLAGILLAIISLKIAPYLESFLNRLTD
ncbi:MAG TPA: phosphatase PAP2 family protein [Candidatus Desulfofervidus auxilii]|uniref:Phosphatase PAP2 family protein n=1 Tax=Desulfofervidus auxilii TaxID=1621989 RepID=A0A7V0NEH7_DESA2|nr:phosphatase PAP2 family protein [Candidatus Desulfofervidus auxilii]